MALDCLTLLYTKNAKRQNNFEVIENIFHYIELVAKYMF